MDLSVTTASTLGTRSLTRDGTGGTAPVFASWKTFDHSGVEKVVTSTIVDSVVQVFNFGTKGWRLQIEIKWCPVALYALLKTDREANTTTPIAASLVTKYAPSGTETTYAFSGVTWLSLTYDKSKTNRSYRVFRDVVCELESVA